MTAFAFDPDKSAANLAKHGIDFEAAQALWDDPRCTVTLAEYVNEDRVLLTATLRDKLWTAVYTRRGDTIRIISVRRARVKEAKDYESQDNQR